MFVENVDCEVFSFGDQNENENGSEEGQLEEQIEKQTNFTFNKSQRNFESPEEKMQNRAFASSK